MLNVALKIEITEVKMGVAYYIVLDNEDPGFDTFVNGKALAHENRLESMCKSIGTKTFDEYLTMSADDIGDILGEDIELPEGLGEAWFSADEGIAYFSRLADHIKENPDAVANPEGCLRDLTDYRAALEKAKVIGAQWHLSMDI